MQLFTRSQMNEDQRTFGEKISDSVAKFGGSWKFIFSSVIFILTWIFIQECICWDKYPYILLNLGLSLVAAFQAPFILMSQRRCEIKQDLIYRSLFKEIKEIVESNLEMEYEVIEKNKKLEEEIKDLKLLLHKILKEKDLR